MSLVIVGGSDAGTEAALAARLTDPSLEITVLVADEYLNFSICGLPFLVSREVDDWRSLAHRDEAQIASRGIDVRLNHRAEAIHPGRKRVRVRSQTETFDLRYDRLIIATGARPFRPSLTGLDLPDVFSLHTMADGIRLRERLDRDRPAAALVVGSGYIGVELADALTSRGIRVTLVGRAPSVLPTVGRSLGGLVATELERNGVTVITGAAVNGLTEDAGRLRATTTDGGSRLVDIAIIGAGVQPNAELAVAAGVATGVSGAIAVGRSMDTSVADIFAAGDCAETWHGVLGRPAYLPLGTTSHKQGRVAGVNAAGGTAEFGGSVGTQVVKVFDLAAARTGLSEAEALAAGFTPASIELVVPDHKRYYPGATELRIRMIGDSGSGRLLGAQIVGNWRAGVARRIDIAAVAIQQGMGVAELSRLDLSYTPPLSSPWDPIQLAADAWRAAAPESSAR